MLWQFQVWSYKFNHKVAAGEKMLYILKIKEKKKKACLEKWLTFLTLFIP